MLFGSCLGVGVDFTNGTGSSAEQSFESSHTAKHEKHLNSLLLGLGGGGEKGGEPQAEGATRG